MGNRLSTQKLISDFRNNKNHIKKLNYIKTNCATLCAKWSTIPNGDMGEMFYNKLLIDYPEVNIYFWRLKPSNTIFSKMMTRLMQAIHEDEDGTYRAFFGCVEHINSLHKNYRIILPAFEAFRDTFVSITREKFSSRDAHNIFEIFDLIINLMNIPDIHFTNRDIKNFLQNHKFALFQNSEFGSYNISRMLEDPIMKIAVKSYVQNNMISDFINLIDRIESITTEDLDSDDQNLELIEFIDEYEEDLCSILGSHKVRELNIGRPETKKILLSLMKSNLARALNSDSDSRNFSNSKCLKYAMIQYE